MGWAGKPVEPRTEWVDHGARWAAPEIARWLSPDPPAKAPDPGFMEAPWDLNPYQYLRHRDPDGEFVQVLIGGGVGATVAASVEAARQYLSGEQLNIRRIMASGAGGAVAGSVAALTGGASLLATMGSGAVGNVAGGAATRAFMGEQTTAGDVLVDASVGAIFAGMFGAIRNAKGAGARVEARSSSSASSAMRMM